MNALHFIILDLGVFEVFCHPSFTGQDIMLMLKRRISGSFKLNMKICRIPFCSEHGRIDEALQILDGFQKTSNSSGACYNSIIVELCKKGAVDIAFDVFSEGNFKGVSWNNKTYLMLIQTIFHRNGSEGVLNLTSRMRHFGLKTLIIMCSEAICVLCKMGFPEVSYHVLLLMKNKGLELTSLGYYSVLQALLYEGKTAFSQHILPSFIKMDGVYDLRVSEMLVHYLCLTDMRKTLTFLSILNDHKFSVTIPVSVFETMINGGRILDAYNLLIRAENNLPAMNVFLYTIMIDTLCKERQIDKALELCAFARKKGICLNTVTYNSVIHGLCRQGCLVEAFRLFDSMEIVGVLASEITYGTLIDALIREGLLMDARMLFGRLLLKGLQPNTHIYNSLIIGYCKSSLLEEAIQLFQELDARNLKPDGFTVGSLIYGHCQTGDMEGALNLFMEFRSKGFLPDFLGFMCAIRGLCDKGRMEESRSILREMLRTQSVIDILGMVDTEGESDSVVNLLHYLCEQGSIHEAVAFLDEVGTVLLSSKRKCSYNASSSHDLEANPNLMSLIHSDFSSHSVPSDENILKFFANGDVRTIGSRNFDSFYALLHSLCLKGELAEANRLIELLIKY